MRVGGVGTVPAAGSVEACTCRLDRQRGRRGGRGRCDGQRWGSVEGCLGRGLRRRGVGGWRRRGRGRRSFLQKSVGCFFNFQFSLTVFRAR